jgi:phosphoketolase
VRIVSVANPRRLFRAHDVAWEHSAQSDDGFMSDNDFAELFGGDVLIGVSGGGTAALEPVLLRSSAAARDLFGWQRGETTASPAELLAFNGITGERIAARAEALFAAIPQAHHAA